MLSLATGHDVGYLTGPVAGGREGYYTGAVAAGEPAGLWYGAGAEELGLRGEVDAELMEAVYSHLLDPRDPAAHARATWGEAEPLAAAHRAYRSADEVYAALLKSHPAAGPEERADLRARAERSARQAVSFIDATFSAPKSVTVLGVAFERAANEARAAGDERAAQAWSRHQRAVEDAVLAGARAGLDYLQDVAGYSRVGHHGGGGGRWIDAHSFVVAQFLQHDSRDRDPQLHVHNAILNRVRCADGTWRSLDGRAIHEHRGAAGAIAERVMEAHLTHALGVEFATRSDGKAREVRGVAPEVLELFSGRRRAITARAAELVDAYRSRFGREPSALERTRIAQQATLATRASKSHDGETLAERLDRWEAECRGEVAGGLAEVAGAVVALAQRVEPAAVWSERDVVERALATVGETRQSWSRSDLTRAISDALPGHVGATPAQVPALLEGLTDVALVHAVALTPPPDLVALPAELQLASGRSAYSRPGGDRFSSAGQLAAERVLRGAAVERGAATVPAADADAVVRRYAEAGRELGVDQAAALRGVLTSGAHVEVLMAAAGTGKSFTVGALAETWTATGRRVFGLAPSQVAAEVLAEEGLAATNTARWLAAQQRLDQAPPGVDPGSDGAWRLQPGDLVVVDEAGMAATGHLAEVLRRCAAVGAKLLLVGDPRQLAAVGPGGALADVAEHGIRYELTEVRRFAAGWERDASLQLRDGDPAALDAYVRHGRLVEGGTAEQAEARAARAWLADTLAGRESLLIVPSNEAAARVSASLRSQLVALGRVEEAGVPLGMDGTVAGVGDLVEARRNGWHLAGHDGNTRPPLNRETYRVTAVRADGGLTVAPVLRDRDEDGEVLGDPISLPAGYVAEHLTLGYASTVHAAQGRTVDTAHAVVGAGIDAAGTYVALTRGRSTNTAWTVTRPVADDSATGEAQATEPRSARAVLADVLDAARQDQSALAEQEQAALAARSVQTHAGQLIDGIEHVTAGRTSAALDRLATAGTLSPQHRAQLAADDALGPLQRLLRTAELAGHRIDDVLHRAVAGRQLDDARSPAQVLHHRITSALHGQLTPRVSSTADLIPDEVPAEWRVWLQERADAADDRRRELGADTAQQAPPWAVEALGPVPDDAVARAEWEHRAGWAAAYRELAGHDDETDPLGAAPPAGLAEKATLFRAAHEALDLPDAGAEEANLSDGQLRMRVRALEREEAWAPRWVGDELDATHQQAARARTDAELWAAHAEAAEADTSRDQLRAEAARAAAEAAELEARAAALEEADAARAAWYLHTVKTRDAAERARTELGHRGVDLTAPDDQVTAQEWLDAHRDEQTVADSDRVIRDEAELVDPDRAELEAAPADVLDERPVETAVHDLRDVSVAEDTEAQDVEDPHRIPTVDETVVAVARAQDALAEIDARREADAIRAEEEDQRRREELARWAEEDQAQDEALAEDLDGELVR